MERRTNYLENQTAPLAYNPFLDREAYLKSTPEELLKINNFTKKQLETHLGERFNVLISTVRYDISDGHLCAEGSVVPVIDSFKKGVGRTGSKEEDLPRELAEIEGFLKTDSFFGSKDAKPGDKRLVISAPSGSYKHNFYDVFTYKNDTNGSFVEMSRYSSGLSIDETVDMLKDKKVIPDNYEADVNFALANPIQISENSIFKTADDIHEFLHENHEFASKEDFDQVLRICTPFIMGYINTLAENPNNLELQLLYYNALLNKADFAYESIVNRNLSLTDGLIFQAAFSKPNLSEVRILGQQEVKTKDVGCGFSGGFSMSSGIGPEIMNSPFSASDYIGEKAKDDPGLCRCLGKEPHFHCPGKDDKGHNCNNEITVGKGITECPKCGTGRNC